MLYIYIYIYIYIYFNSYQEKFFFNIFEYYCLNNSILDSTQVKQGGVGGSIFNLKFCYNLLIIYP